MSGSSLCTLLFLIEILKCIFVITTEVRDYIVYREINIMTVTLNTFCISSLGKGGFLASI